MTRLALPTLFATLYAALLAAPNVEASASRPPDLACRLEAEPGSVAGGPVKVRFTLSNRGAIPLRVLRWQTPLEGFWSDMLDVIYGGRKLAYEGPLMKRGDPGPEDYVEIAPRKSVTAVVDLAGPYDVRRAGTYEVAFTRGLPDVVRSGEKFPRPRGEHRRRALACGPVRIEVTAK
ncbi:MAG: protease [Acidobacteriota bacterium]